MKKIVFVVIFFLLIIIVGVVIITGRSFGPSVSEPLTSTENTKPIGGEKDEHGCLGAAGYTYSEEIDACVRPWEIQGDDQINAGRIAVQSMSTTTENTDNKAYTITEVRTLSCDKCFSVTLELDKTRQTVKVANDKIVETDVIILESTEDLEDSHIFESLTEKTARELAETSGICVAEGEVGEFEAYNENSKTWWFELLTVKGDCQPACVVNEETLITEINWRCTGLKIPTKKETEIETEIE